MIKKKIRLNYNYYPFGSVKKMYLKGSIITIQCDSAGVPVDNYWYRRYLDSKIDNCIEFLETSAKKIKKSKLKEDAINE